MLYSACSGGTIFGMDRIRLCAIMFFYCLTLFLGRIGFIFRTGTSFLTVSRIRLLLVCQTEQVVYACMVESGQLDETFDWDVAQTDFVIGIRDLRAIQICSNILLQKIMILT